MNGSPTVVLGKIHHGDAARTLSQQKQSQLVETALRAAGIGVIEFEEFEQNLTDPSALPFFRVQTLVLRRLWAQEIHHLREIRRRKGKSLKIPFRKRRKALARILGVIVRRETLIDSFLRLEIEAALSLKHVRMWSKVLENETTGAVVLEDDFFLRDDKSAQNLASLIQKHCRDYDLVDLAGGLSRDSLGLADYAGQDLSLPFMVANTTCAYFISSRACHALLKMVASHQELLYLAPDFLITELNARGFLGSSFLPFDLPLAHGSRDGTVESSIPY